MLPSQRDLFEIPRHICYLNAASYSPLPLRTLEAGRAAVGRKGTHWTVEADFANEQNERARAAAARLINADAADIALIPSVSYGVATAAKSHSIGLGTRVLVLEDDHSSPVLEWQVRTEAQGFTVETIKRPDDGDWTTAVLASIERLGAPPVSLASISSVHWSDGGLIDVEKIGAEIGKQDAAFLVDATQGAGVLAMDVKHLDPDFVIFRPTNGCSGPYGRAFLYVAKRHQGGVPLEQTSAGRRNIRAENAVYFHRSQLRRRRAPIRHGRARLFYLDGDGLDRHGNAGRVGRSSRSATSADADGADFRGVRGIGVSVPEPHLRAPHILSLTFKGGTPGRLIKGLASEGVYVAPCFGRIRMSAHFYNDEVDADRFVAALARRLRG
jgi:selenocysteine lyase/cysteine desulfurase